MDKEYRFDTLQVHAGQVPDPATGARAVPIYQSTSFVFEDADDAAQQFMFTKPGSIYTRLANPTTDVLEKRMAALEHGVASVCFATGMAAITAAVLNLAETGDDIVATSTLYGGTYTLFNNRFKQRCGINVTMVDADDLAGIERAITPRTKCIYVETLGNPNINIPDFDGISAIAKKYKIPVIADNTFGTPYLFDAKQHGVDITVHSLTKYAGGHGTTLGGCVTDLGTFDFKGNPRFPEFNTPDAACHGMVYADLKKAAYITKLRTGIVRDVGATLSPFNSFLLLLGLETLSLRVKKHTENAEAVAKYLSEHPYVAWVNYPSLPGSKYYERAKKYLPKGVGGIMTFGIKGGVDAGRKFINSTKLFSLLANVADAKSLVIHPASTTHSQLDEEGLKAAGVGADMIRLSIGIEDIEDIIEDLEQALIASQK